MGIYLNTDQWLINYQWIAIIKINQTFAHLFDYVRDQHYNPSETQKIEFLIKKPQKIF